jgi:hypothetical protein
LRTVSLDYQHAPRPGVVFGCLMPAPWLGAAEGLLLALGPAAGLPDRFAPAWLASAGGLAFALANGWLGLQLLKAMRCMRAMRARGGLPPRQPVAEGVHHG